MYKNLSSKLNKVWLFLAIGASILVGFSIFTTKSVPNNSEKKTEDEIAYSNCQLTSNDDQLQTENTPLETDESIGLIDFEKDTIKGVEKGSIPQISTPKFMTSELASKCIRQTEEVFVVTINKVTKVYPEKILNWHEVVNDEIRDEVGNTIPIVITYSPLTNSATAFVRKLDNVEYKFGMSGRIWQNIPLLYDNKTESLWSQMTGEGLIGNASGKKLEVVQVERKLFKDITADDEIQVLSFDTGYVRNYDTDPYHAYRKSNDLFYPGSTVSDKLENKDLVIGISVNGTTKAYPLSLIDGELEDKIGEQNIRIIKISAAEYSAVRILSDKKTEQLYSVISYWYAWSGSYPKTTVFEE